MHPGEVLEMNSVPGVMPKSPQSRQRTRAAPFRTTVVLGIKGNAGLANRRTIGRGRADLAKKSFDFRLGHFQNGGGLIMIDNDWPDELRPASKKKLKREKNLQATY
jgi:hypothetical protein